MFAHHPHFTRELAARKAGTVVHTHRVQPHFGPIGIPLDMHMPIRSDHERRKRTDRDRVGER
jgi:hypothetical protein